MFKSCLSHGNTIVINGDKYGNNTVINVVINIDYGDKYVCNKLYYILINMVINRANVRLTQWLMVSGHDE